MSNQFNPGDLVLIINSYVPENIGKTVRLVEFIKPGGAPFIHEGVHFPSRKEATWIVESLDGSKSLVGGYVRRNVMVSSGPCRQKWLMPLRGDFEFQLKYHKEKEHCA